MDYSYVKMKKEIFKQVPLHFHNFHRGAGFLCILQIWENDVQLDLLDVDVN
jgi:hypothetical protein